MKTVYRHPFYKLFKIFTKAFNDLLHSFDFVQYYEICAPVTYLSKDSENHIGISWQLKLDRFVKFIVFFR